MIYKNFDSPGSDRSLDFFRCVDLALAIRDENTFRESTNRIPVDTRWISRYLKKQSIARFLVLYGAVNYETIEKIAKKEKLKARFKYV